MSLSSRGKRAMERRKQGIVHTIAVGSTKVFKVGDGFCHEVKDDESGK